MRRLRRLLLVAGLLACLSPAAALATGVNTATGAFVTQAADLALPGLGTTFDFARTYNSNADAGGPELDDPLGPRWHHAYETSISIDASGNVLVTATDGQQAVFTKSGSNYIAPDGVRALLTYASGPASYTLTKLADGSQTVFDGSTGHVSSMTDRHDHGLTFGYSSGLLSTITDEAGRQVDLAYASIDGHSRLASVTMPDSREVTYAYASDFNHSLASVTDAAGKETDYSYAADEQARLQMITDAKGHDIVTNTYDDDGRVVSQDDALGRTTTYEWDESTPTAHVTTTKPNGATYIDSYEGNVLVASRDPLGHDRTYAYDGALNRVQIVDGRGVEADMTYDASGNLTQMSVPSAGISESRTYDSENQLTSATDPNGHTTSYTYNAGDVTSVENADGGTTYLTYDANDQVDTVTDPRGKTTSYGYDADFNRTGTTTEEGRASVWAYDASGRLTSATDANGGVTAYAYDADNRVSSMTDPRSHETTYAYDNVGNLVSVTDPASGETTTSFDALNRPTEVTDANDHTTTTAYDQVGNVLSVTSATGGESSFNYDLANRVTEAVTADGNAPGATAADYTWHYSYDANGNRTAAEDPLSGTTTTTYDDMDRPTAVEDPLGKTTTYAYDDVGNRTSVTDPNSNQTTTTYDEMGRPLVTTSPEGRTTTKAYDAAGNLLSITDGLGDEVSFSYDDDGFLASAVDPRGNEVSADPNDFRTTYTRDDAGAVTQVEDPLGHTVSTAYDAAGNVVSVTDPNGHTTSYAYDALDRVSLLTRPGSEVTGFTYDAVGNQLTRTDANSNVTTFAYDDSNRLTSTTLPTGEQSTIAYDAEGHPVTTVTGRGNASMTPATGTISRGFDALGRLTGVDYGDATPDVGFTHDADGRLTQMDDGPGTQTYAYDDGGRLTGVTRGTDTFGYSYDGDGLITGRTQPGSVTIGATYDDAGRIASITAAGVTSGYSYDAAGNFTGTSLPSGTGYSTNRSFDEAGRLTAVTNTNGTILSKFEQTLDPVGNPTRIDTTRGGSVTSQAFSYDANNRLSEWCPSASSCTSPSAYTSFSYDPVGNRTQQARVSVASPGTTTYAYDDSNRMTSSTIGGTTTAYGYDADGNQTSAGATTTAYDLTNQMISIDDGTTSTSFLYDGQGNRVRATTGSAQVRYLWDPQNSSPELAIERDASNALIRRYVQGSGGSPLSMTDGSATYYPLSDLIGSTADLVNASGTAQSKYVYEPFGQTTETQLVGGAPANPVRFSGEYQDPSGQYFLRARQYDPTSGRFTSGDPLDINDGSSAFAYVGNRPGVLIDPSGMLGVSDVTGAVSSGAGAVGDFGAGVAEGTYNAGALAVGTVWENRALPYNMVADPIRNAYTGCSGAYSSQGGGLAGSLACFDNLNPLEPVKHRLEAWSRGAAMGCWSEIGEQAAPILVGIAVAVVAPELLPLIGAETEGLAAIEVGTGGGLRAALRSPIGALRSGARAGWQRVRGAGSAAGGGSAARAGERLPWTSWESYPKVSVGGRDYAQVGERLYTRHAVERTMPRGLTTEGRSISPNNVEGVIQTGSRSDVVVDGVPRQIYRSGTVEVVTEQGGGVVVTVNPYKYAR